MKKEVMLFLMVIAFSVCMLLACDYWAATPKTEAQAKETETETETEFEFYTIRENGTKNYGTPVYTPQPKKEYVISDGYVQMLIDGEEDERWEIPELREDARLFNLIGMIDGNDTLAIQNGTEVWFLIAGEGEPELLTSRGHVVTYSVWDETVTSCLVEGEDGELYLTTLGFSSFPDYVKVEDEEGILDASILDNFVKYDVFSKDGKYYRVQVRAWHPKVDSPSDWGKLEYAFLVDELKMN